jgi:hypothetical protein
VPVELPETPRLRPGQKSGAGMFGITWENLGVNGIAASSPVKFYLQAYVQSKSIIANETRLDFTSRPDARVRDRLV